ncbi:MAG: flagellin [Rhodanobacteraceae bacterium]
MSLVLNTNVTSLNSQDALTNTESSLQTAMERLSTGLRINSSADDPAGYAIAQGMTTQINGMQQATQNANDGVSLIQTASGALNQITANLQTIRQLAVEAANATNTGTDRADLNTEAQQLVQENDREASQTQFNGENLLDGSFSDQVFQVGANVGDTISVSSILNASSSALGTTTFYSTSVTGAAMTDPTGGANFADIAAGDLEINGVSVGAVAGQATAAGQAQALATAINNVSSQSGVQATVNADSDGIDLSSTSSAGIDITLGTSATATNTGLTAATTAATATVQTGYAGLDLSTAAGANQAMQLMDSALNAINTSQANLGAYQNRFQAAVSNLQTDQQNLTAARSGIEDTDYASETASMTQDQIMEQAGVAMVAQANQTPQLILKLLGD